VVIASIPMALVVLLVSNLSGSTSTAGLFGRVVGAVVGGGITFAGGVFFLGRRHDSARRRPPPPPPPEPPPRPSRPLDTPRIVPYRP
jgi:hypothetical protein